MSATQTETRTTASNEALKSFHHLNKDYKYLTPEDAEHFLAKGWLCVPGAIEQEYIDRWMKDL